MKKRISTTNINLPSYVKCKKVYPLEGTRKNIEELKTIGLKLSKSQAVEFAGLLLAASRSWSEIDITAYRKKESDSLYRITVTSKK